MAKLMHTIEDAARDTERGPVTSAPDPLCPETSRPTPPRLNAPWRFASGPNDTLAASAGTLAVPARRTRPGHWIGSVLNAGWMALLLTCTMECVYLLFSAVRP